MNQYFVDKTTAAMNGLPTISTMMNEADDDPTDQDKRHKWSEISQDRVSSSTGDGHHHENDHRRSGTLAPRGCFHLSSPLLTQPTNRCINHGSSGFDHQSIDLDSRPDGSGLSTITTQKNIPPDDHDQSADSRSASNCQEYEQGDQSPSIISSTQH
jgi:hypothetical protein